MDGDPVTPYNALIQYAVEDTPYQIRADISRYTVRRFGKGKFIGHSVPVFYNPSDPSDAYADRIDRLFFDRLDL